MMLMRLYLQNKSSCLDNIPSILLFYLHIFGSVKTIFLQGHTEKRRMTLNWELVYIQYKEEILYYEGVEMLEEKSWLPHPWQIPTTGTSD